MGGLGKQSRVLRILLDLSSERPKLVLGAWVLVTILCVAVTSQLEIDTTISSALNRSDEAWATYEESLSRHGGDEFVTVAVEGDHGFDSSTLELVLDLSEQFLALDGIRRVDSLATVPLVRREGADVRVDAGLTRDIIGDPERERKYWDLVARDRLAHGTLASRDGRVVALNLIFDDDVDGDREAAVQAIRVVLDGRRAWLSGVPVVRAEAGRRTRIELAIFVPATVVLVGVVLAILFRRIVPVLAALGVGGVGNALCLASMVVGGTTLSFSTLILPSVVLALGCAYAMHVLLVASGREGNALRVALDSVAPAIALSGLTTAIGFLAMATVRISLIRDLAFYGALGVLYVTLASLTLAVAIVSLWTVRPSESPGVARLIARSSGALMAFVGERRWLILGSWAVATIIAGFGATRLNVASDVILWFPEESELRRDYEAIRSRLSGITPVNILIDGRRGQSVLTSESISAIDALSQALEDRKEVGRVISVADPLRQIHEAFSVRSDAGLPTDPALVDQYLLLLSDADQLNDVLSVDRASANILLRVDQNSSAAIVRLGDWVERWWSENGPADYRARTTGIMYEFGRAQDEIAYGGMRGLGLALGVVAVLLMVTFRDLRLALVAMIPNALPIAMAFGLMGALGIPLDAATVCLGGLALGIAVDDTIHVLAGVLDEQRRGGDTLDAFVLTFERVLPALAFSTLSIGVGFAVLGLSEFTLVRNLGLITAGVVAVCLAADALLLPALLLRGPPPRR